MLDFSQPMILTLRPVTLVRAARHAVGMQPQRARLLRRVLRGAPFPPAATPELVERLRDQEAMLNELRLAADLTYSGQAHVEALAALLMETRALRGLS